MLARFRLVRQPIDDALLVVARALLAWIFLHEGFVLAANLDGTLGVMGKLGVSPPLAVATIALQLGAGLAILLGWQTRLAALALGLFCLATALMFHTNFGSRNELLHFEKDLAIAGGMIGLLVRGPGRCAIDAFLSPWPSGARRVPGLRRASGEPMLNGRDEGAT